MATMRQMSNMVAIRGDQTIEGAKTFNSSITASNVNLNEGVNPPGTVIYVARSTAPTGYIKANGATVSRSTYAGLFTAIGTVFGAGDGSTTFVLPDLRGEFIRGWDDARGVDSGREIGASQVFAIQNITGTITAGPNASAITSKNGADGAFYNSGNRGYINTGPSSSGWPVEVIFDASRVVNTATETRPRNVALLACIKT